MLILYVLICTQKTKSLDHILHTFKVNSMMSIIRLTVRYISVGQFMKELMYVALNFFILEGEQTHD